MDSVTIVSGADIKPEAIDWLWPGWLAAGKLHILAGVPGTGKSTIALALAATITSAGRWPDGTSAAPTAGSVALWSGEDAPGDTLVPRLMAMGADMELIHFVKGTMDYERGPRAFDPATDIPALSASLKGQAPDLLIVDPVVSAVASDSHKNAEVRRALQPLCDLAVEHGCAVLGISHFTKGTAGRSPLERVTGSLAFGALPRVVMAAAKLPDDGENRGGRVFARVKSNIGPDDGGFKYDLHQTELADYKIEATEVLWGEALEGDARELLAEADATDDDRSATDEAIDFLRDALAGGAMKASEVQKEAKQAGISDKSLRRAREKLGIRPRKASFQGGWRWMLPGEDAPQDAQDAQKQNGASWASSGHLGAESSGHTDKGSKPHNMESSESSLPSGAGVESSGNLGPERI